MASEIEVRIKLFGPFRSLSSQDSITLCLPHESTSLEVKKELEKHLTSSASFDVRSLLSHSVFADEDHILEESDPIQSGMHLAVLPPVCGG